MKKILLSLSVLFFVFLIIFPISGKAEEDIDNPQKPSFEERDIPEPDGIIIKYRDSVSPDKQTQIINKFIEEDSERRIVRNIELDNFKSVSVPSSEVSNAIEELKNNNEIEYVEPDYYYRYLFTPNDPQFSSQWWLSKIQAPSAWDISKGNPAVFVAIVDSGVNIAHPDLASKIAKSMNTQVDEPNHGTHVAGIAASATNNSLGVAGIGFNIKLLVADVGNARAVSSSAASTAIRWAADNGAVAINCSWGGAYSSTLKSAIDYAISKGSIVVVAAGNDGTSKADYPASHSGVVTVAATNSGDSLAKFSNRGSWVTLAAPGVRILSTVGSSSYAIYDGTSMAAPVVTGLAGLIKAAFPSYTATQIKDRLCSTADKIAGTGTNFRCGRVNAYKAVLGGGIVGPTPTPSPAPPDPTKSLVFKLRFQGVTEKAKPQNIKAQLTLNGSTIYSGTISSTSDENGIYTILIDNSKEKITIGTYDLKVKGTSHLQRKIANLAYAGGGQTYDLTKQENQMLRAGDVNGDNKITIADVSQILRYYTKFSITVDNVSTMEASDVNKDGAITIQDIALTAINWSDFAVQGDN